MSKGMVRPVKRMTSATTRSFRSVDDRHSVDLDQAARVGGEPHHLDRRRRRFGIAKIFAPDAIERVLIREVGDEAISSDHVRERRTYGLQTALEILQRRLRLPRHVARHGVEFLRSVWMM